MTGRGPPRSGDASAGPSVGRRRYLLTAGAAVGGGLAGCGGLFETETVSRPDVLEDRPAQVYVPTHVDGMAMIGMERPGRLGLALSYTYPHRFWLVDGDRTNMVAVADEDSVHLMVSVWDGETGRVLPSSSATLAVTREGEPVLDRPMWPMLSQRMGFHYGDNVSLPGDGAYEVTVRFGPVGTRRSGAFREAFGERVAVTIPFEYSAAERDDLAIEATGQRAGREDALEPMAMEMLPVPQLPAADALPGTAIGSGLLGDARFVGTVLEAPPAGIDASGGYLAVSPRTPYNRYPIPFMPLSATVATGGEPAFDGALAPAIDSDFGYHYGAAVEGLDAEATIAVTVDNAAQIARHEGYETAFLDRGTVTLTG